MSNIKSISIPAAINCLQPESVKQLKKLGINTSCCMMYWEEIAPGVPAYNLKRKETPNINNGIDAPTYLELKLILPRFINTNDKTYFLTELTDTTGTVMVYCTEHINDILLEVYDEDPCQMVFKMIEKCIENKYL